MRTEFVGFRLDAETLALLRALATQHDGNLSMTVRYAIRAAAQGLTLEGGVDHAK